MNEFFKKNILKGFYFSLGIHFLLVLVFYIGQALSREEQNETVVKIFKYSELGTPPSILMDRSTIIKKRAGKKEIFATPKAVKKIEKDTVTIAKQNLSGSKEGDLSGTGSGEIKVIPEAAPKEVKPKPEIKYYAAVDFMPMPTGGYNTIQARVVKPEQAKQNNISGKVLVKTYIDDLGKVVRTEIIQGLGFGCDEAAMRAVRSTRFSPGKLGGQYVRVQMVVTVFF